MRDRKPDKVEGGDVSREDAKVRKDRKEEQGLAPQAAIAGYCGGGSKRFFVSGCRLWFRRGGDSGVGRRWRAADAAGDGAVFVGGGSRAVAGGFRDPVIRRSARAGSAAERALCVLLVLRGGARDRAGHRDGGGQLLARHRTQAGAGCRQRGVLVPAGRGASDLSGAGARGWTGGAVGSVCIHRDVRAGAAAAGVGAGGSCAGYPAGGMATSFRLLRAAGGSIEVWNSLPAP